MPRYFCSGCKSITTPGLLGPTSEGCHNCGCGAEDIEVCSEERAMQRDLEWCAERYTPNQLVEILSRMALILGPVDGTWLFHKLPEKAKELPGLYTKVSRLEDALRITQRDRDSQARQQGGLDDENARLRERNWRLREEAEKKQVQYERQKQISLKLAEERDKSHRILRALAVNMIEHGGPNGIAGRCLACGARWMGDRGGETHEPGCVLVEARELLG